MLIPICRYRYADTDIQFADTDILANRYISITLLSAVQCLACADKVVRNPIGKQILKNVVLNESPSIILQFFFEIARWFCYFKDYNWLISVWTLIYDFYEIVFYPKYGNSSLCVSLTDDFYYGEIPLSLKLSMMCQILLRWLDSRAT